MSGLSLPDHLNVFQMAYFPEFAWSTLIRFFCWCKLRRSDSQHPRASHCITFVHQDGMERTNFTSFASAQLVTLHLTQHISAEQSWLDSMWRRSRAGPLFAVCTSGIWEEVTRFDDMFYSCWWCHGTWAEVVNELENNHNHLLVEFF